MLKAATPQKQPSHSNYLHSTGEQGITDADEKVRTAIRRRAREWRERFPTLLETRDLAGLSVLRLWIELQQALPKPKRYVQKSMLENLDHAIKAHIRLVPELVTEGQLLPHDANGMKNNAAFVYMKRAYSKWLVETFKPIIRPVANCTPLSELPLCDGVFVRIVAEIGREFGIRTNTDAFLKTSHRIFYASAESSLRKRKGCVSPDAWEKPADIIDFMDKLAPGAMDMMPVAKDSNEVRLNERTFKRDIARSSGQSQKKPIPMACTPVEDLEVFGRNVSTRSRSDNELTNDSADLALRLREVPIVGPWANDRLRDLRTGDHAAFVELLQRIKNALERAREDPRLAAAIVCLALNKPRKDVAEAFDVSVDQVREKAEAARRLLKA